jgi:hypothetical protein
MGGGCRRYVDAAKSQPKVTKQEKHTNEIGESDGNEEEQQEEEDDDKINPADPKKTKLALEHAQRAIVPYW